jgi:hypothetical protein
MYTSCLESFSVMIIRCRGVPRECLSMCTYLLSGVLLCDDYKVQGSTPGVPEYGVNHSAQHPQNFWNFIRILLSVTANFSDYKSFCY